MSCCNHDIQSQLDDALCRVDFLEKMLAQRFARSSPIEEKLMNAAMGKRPLPTAEECKEWSAKLGVPDEWRTVK